MLQFRDVKEENRVRDVAAYEIFPLHSNSTTLPQICIFSGGNGLAGRFMGLIWLCSWFIGRNSEAKEHRRRSGQKRRLERRKGRRGKGVFDPFQEKSPAGIGFSGLVYYFPFSQLRTEGLSLSHEGICTAVYQGHLSRA